MKNRNLPRYINGDKVNFIGLSSYLGKYFFQRKKYPLYNRSFSKSLQDLKELRNSLNLTRTVKFNGKYFSSPIVPAFPSKAFDTCVANGGLNYKQMGTSKKLQLDSAFLAITDKCNLNCKHCYEKHNIISDSNGAKVPIKKWKEVINYLQNRGTSVIILTGGEPLVDFSKLMEIILHINKELSDVHLHTSGNGITEEKVRKLKSAGLRAVAVGLDDYDEMRFDRLRGSSGALKNAVNALQLFNKHGIFTYVNCCITHDLIEDGNLYKYYEFVKQLNVGIIQLLEPRPFGGYNLDDVNRTFTSEDKQRTLEFYNEVMNSDRYNNYPVVYYVSEIESKEKMGCCMGGLSHLYVDSKGNVNPCVFLPIRFGNIMDDKIEEIVIKMRNFIPKPIKRQCPSLTIGQLFKEKPAVNQAIKIEELTQNFPQNELESIFNFNKE